MYHASSAYSICVLATMVDILIVKLENYDISIAGIQDIKRDQILENQLHGCT